MTEQSKATTSIIDPSGATESPAPGQEAVVVAQSPTPVTDLQKEFDEALRLLRAFRVLEGANKTMGKPQAKVFILQWLKEIDVFLTRHKKDQT